jgi:hypothetical protein
VKLKSEAHKGLSLLFKRDAQDNRRRLVGADEGYLHEEGTTN